MTYRSILVHLDASPRCALRTDIAIGLAREHGAHLLGLAPAGLINLPARGAPTLRGESSGLELAQARLNERAAALVGDFCQRVRAAGLASHEGRIDIDDSAHSLVQNARVHDLVVLGQTDRGAPAAGLETDIPEQVFIHAGTPALVVPAAGAFADIGRRIVLAWNGSRESVRAGHDALPLLRRAESVHLVCLERSNDLHHLSRWQLDDAGQWLARHGVSVVPHHEMVSGDVGAALLACIGELGADLVVMGGYGHSRVSEFLLGGVTRRLLARMTVPVLLSH